VLIIDYRGYGNSQGTPSETGLKYDAKATLEFLMNRKDINQEKIYVFGRSLGGAVAV
jgi:abhydrolase domain-containing protein 13